MDRINLLHQAILRNNKEAVKDLLEKGEDPNRTIITSCITSALHVAVNTGNKEIVELLLKYGSDANQERCLLSGKTETPLGAAIGNAYERLCNGEQADYENCQEIIEALLINGANIDRIDRGGDRGGDRVPFLRGVVYSADTNTAKLLIRYTLLHNLETEKPEYITNNPELLKYWNNQIKKEIFLKNNEGIFDNMSKYDKYVINRDDSLDKLTSDAENFLKETQEKLGIVIDRAEFIEYRVKKRYPASLKALTFGNVPFECYEELSGGILDDPNVEQSKIGKAIG